jgi:hypothetical protein
MGGSHLGTRANGLHREGCALPRGALLGRATSMGGHKRVSPLGIAGLVLVAIPGVILALIKGLGPRQGPFDR